MKFPTQTNESGGDKIKYIYLKDAGIIQIWI